MKTWIDRGSRRTEAEKLSGGQQRVRHAEHRNCLMLAVLGHSPEDVVKTLSAACGVQHKDIYGLTVHDIALQCGYEKALEWLPTVGPPAV